MLPVVWSADVEAPVGSGSAAWRAVRIEAREVLPVACAAAVATIAISASMVETVPVPLFGTPADTPMVVRLGIG